MPHRAHGPALTSRRTPKPAGPAAGFAAVNLTWSRLPQRLHRAVPLCGLIILAGAEAALSATVRIGWDYAIAGPLLLTAGAGHGASFGALVPQITGRTRPAHIPTISGLITTITQLAIVAGIATLGGLYLAIAHPGQPRDVRQRPVGCRCHPGHRHGRRGRAGAAADLLAAEEGSGNAARGLRRPVSVPSGLRQPPGPGCAGRPARGCAGRPACLSGRPGGCLSGSPRP